jgi:glutaminyl-peptide cyclotransferase
MKSKLLLALLVIIAAGGIYCNGKDEGEDTPPSASLNISKPINIYPHDTSSFTEGMEFHNGLLYESAGGYGSSYIAIRDYKTGKVLKKQTLPKEYFGEGMTILNDKLYMLTWKERKVFVFDPVTLQQTGSLNWPYEFGWGMTNNDTSLIANTGGSTIFFLDPANLKEQRKINVTDEYGPVSSVNEMEYVNGYIYANVFETEQVLKIDAQTGKIVARTDLVDMYPEYNHLSQKSQEKNGQVMNGIAYNPDTKTFLLTGKNWPKMFEVKID